MGTEIPHQATACHSQKQNKQTKTTTKILNNNKQINKQTPTGINPRDIELGNWFLDMTKAQVTKEKNKLDFIKIKNLCASKDIVNKVKR